MPVTTNKQRVLTALFTTLKKHYGEPAAPPDRPVLEQMVYAVLYNLLNALLKTGVGVCGGPVVKPLAGRTEVRGTPRN